MNTDGKLLRATQTSTVHVHPLLIRVHRRSSGAPRQGEPIWRGYYNIGYELEESDCPE
jgi:hypothetical protein